MKIHPTAILGSEVQLGENVEIGPYCIIDDGVSIGDNCVIQAHAIVTGAAKLGSGNRIGYGSVIGSEPQDFAHHPGISSGVEIGSNNQFREYVTIHRGTKEGTVTRVGDQNFLMTGVHLGHNVTLGNRNVIANNCLLAGYATVGNDVVLGGGAVFHQFLRVGSMCMIRGGTAWSKDIPPYTVGAIINSVRGINAVGMRRKGFSSAARADVKRAYQLFYRQGLNVSQAIEKSYATEWTPEAQVFIDFVRERTKRGLCDGKSGLGSEAD